jgi:hypothetical protein
MKTIFAVLLLLSSTQAIDWRYEARICGNLMVGESGIQRAARQVRSEGCWDVKVEHLFEDQFLVYGTKVDRASY